MKIAVLIDGDFFIRRLKKLNNNNDLDKPNKITSALQIFIENHLEQANQLAQVSNPKSLLYRVFYYDAHPFEGKLKLPISNEEKDYKETKIADTRRNLHAALRTLPYLALRLGVVHFSDQWTLKPSVVRLLREGKRDIASLTDKDFNPEFRQKGVDMRIGLDIARLTLMRQVDTIILVTGDNDFVPAAKLARIDGVNIFLDSLQSRETNNRKGINLDLLLEHCDGERDGLRGPKQIL